MVKEKEIPKGYKQTEFGVIPENWERVTLNSISNEIGDGIHSTPYYVKSSNYFFVNGNNLLNGKIFISAETKCVSLSEFNLLKKKLGKQTILMSINGTIGNLAFYNNENIVLGKSAAYINLVQNIDKYLIYYLLQHNTIIKFYKNELTGSTIKNLSLTSIRETPITIPLKKSEQTAIATILVEIDTLTTHLDLLLIKKKNIKQGTMHELLTGKKRLPGYNGEWEEKALGDIVDVKDGTHQTPKYFNSGIPFYSVESVTNNDFTNTKYISDNEHRILTKKFKIEEMDILMTRIGSIGDCKLIDWKPNASFYVSLALLKPKNKLSAPYIYQFSKTIFFKRELEDRSLQWAIPKKINLGEISKVKISIPKDINEQTAIAKILSDIDTEIEALEQKRDKYILLKQGMMEQLLTGKIRIV